MRYLVEIMTYVTWKLSAFPVNRVIGIGCNLDSQRLQYIITTVLKAQTSGKQVWVIGEQGEDKGKKYMFISHIDHVSHQWPRHSDTCGDSGIVELTRLSFHTRVPGT